MPDMRTAPIKTARLELGPLGVDDADEMASVLADPALHGFTGGVPLGRDALRERFAHLVVGHSRDGGERWHNWIVRETQSGQAVGTVQATVTDGGKSAEVAWVIGVPWQGRGFAAESSVAMVDWLEGAGVTSLTAFIHPAHAASEGVARVLGLVCTDTVVDDERAWRGSTGGVHGPRIRRLPTDSLSGSEVRQIRGLLAAAFGVGDEAFTDDDWAHAVGGRHFILEIGGEIVSHAAVARRELHVEGRPVRTGYVEAVATSPDRENRGYGSRLMEAVSGFVRDRYELGALGTGRIHFYERFGWRTWQGPSYVRAPGGQNPTPDDDGYIMVLETPTSPAIDLAATISCEWRAGDVW